MKVSVTSFSSPNFDLDTFAPAEAEKWNVGAQIVVEEGGGSEIFTFEIASLDHLVEALRLAPVFVAGRLLVFAQFAYDPVELAVQPLIDQIALDSADWQAFETTLNWHMESEFENIDMGRPFPKGIFAKIASKMESQRVIPIIPRIASMTSSEIDLITFAPGAVEKWCFSVEALIADGTDPGEVFRFKIASLAFVRAEIESNGYSSVSRYILFNEYSIDRLQSVLSELIANIAKDSESWISFGCRLNWYLQWEKENFGPSPMTKRN